MIDPEEIRRMVQQRRIPENSRILYGSALWTFRNLWARIALMPLVPGIISLLSALGIMGDVPPENIDSIMAHFIAYTALVLIPVAGIITPLLVALMARRSALVFIPGGWIDFDNLRSSNPDTWRVFSYASISEIQFKLSFWLGPHLVIRDYQGRTWKWSADACYGPRGRTFQNILIAYTISTVMNKIPI